MFGFLDKGTQQYNNAVLYVETIMTLIVITTIRTSLCMILNSFGHVKYTIIVNLSSIFIDAGLTFAFVLGADIGVIEVFHKGKAEHLAEADRHIGIAGKVKVNLQRIADCTEPREQKGQFPARQRKYIVRNHRKHIGQQDLFGKTDDKAVDARGKFGKRMLSCTQQRVDILIADNRPCNELRKHRNIECELGQIILRLDLTPIDVDHIAERLKGIERNADRHDHLEENIVCVQYLVGYPDEKIEILIKTQNTEIDRNAGKQKNPAAPPMHQYAEHIIDEDRRQHDDNQSGLTIKIEAQTEQQQNHVSQHQMPLRHNIIHRKGKGQKVEQKD